MSDASWLRWTEDTHETTCVLTVQAGRGHPQALLVLKVYGREIGEKEGWSSLCQGPASAWIQVLRWSRGTGTRKKYDYQVDCTQVVPNSLSCRYTITKVFLPSLHEWL